jgi:hypothetical protein
MERLIILGPVKNVGGDLRIGATMEIDIVLLHEDEERRHFGWAWRRA